MRKTLIALLAILLVAVTLAACGKGEAAKSTEPKETLPAKKDPVSQYKAEGFAPSTLKNQVSWEGLTSLRVPPRSQSFIRPIPRRQSKRHARSPWISSTMPRLPPGSLRRIGILPTTITVPVRI